MAGRFERKLYVLDLFRAGVAPILLLSVDRFEVSKTKRFQLPFADLGRRSLSNRLNNLRSEKDQSWNFIETTL